MWTILSSVWTWELLAVLLLGIFPLACGHWPYSWTMLLSLILADAFCWSPEPSLCAAASFLVHCPINSSCFGLLKTLISVSLTWHNCQVPLVPPSCAVALKPPLGSKLGQFQSLVHLLFLQGAQSCVVYCPLFENCYFICFVWFPSWLWQESSSINRRGSKFHQFKWT